MFIKRVMDASRRHEPSRFGRVTERKARDAADAADASAQCASASGFFGNQLFCRAETMFSGNSRKSGRRSISWRRREQ